MAWQDSSLSGALSRIPKALLVTIGAAAAWLLYTAPAHAQLTASLDQSVVTVARPHSGTVVVPLLATVAVEQGYVAGVVAIGTPYLQDERTGLEITCGDFDDFVGPGTFHAKFLCWHASCIERVS